MLALALGLAAANAARADFWSSALGYRCLSDPDHLALYPVHYDANLPAPASRDGLFVQANRGDAPEVFDVVSCRLGSGRVVVRRVHQHQPAARGPCGAQPHARYQVLYDDTVVASFYNGCATVIVLAGPHDLTICGDICVAGSWSDKWLPVRVGLWGEVERP